MPDSRLDAVFGPANVGKLASAYEDALRILSGGDVRRVPPREVRMAVVSAIVALASRGEFDVTALRGAALDAVAANGNVRQPVDGA